MPTSPCILLIDDNPDNTALLCLALEECVPNVQLSIVSNQEGLHEYLSHLDRQIHQIPWLIFLTAYFPTKIDGLNALIRLRHHFSRPSNLPTPIIAMSLSQHLGDIQEFYESGAHSYLVKSVDYQRLVSDCQTLSRYWFQIVTLPHGSVE